MRKMVAEVSSGSLAELYHIQKGYELYKIGDMTEFDIIDFMVFTANEKFSMTFIDNCGNEKVIDFVNRQYLPIGISFEHLTIDEPKQCANKCVFCFMDQMPKGMRDTLYFKDDDYRLSFLCGNYITTTNMTDEDVDRVLRLNLSPMNISIHTTNPKLRRRMLCNMNASKIFDTLTKFKEGNIDFNAQLVLVPGYNIEDELCRSLEDILKLLPNVLSLSCVPVGISGYRDNLAKLTSFTKEEAENVIDSIDIYRKKALEICGEEIFHASDEFFLIAERDFPPDEYYGDYSQYENGVGMARSFIDDVENNIDEFANEKELDAICITGELGKEILSPIIDMLNQRYEKLNLELIAIKNEFFGGDVTASGLVCGGDIINVLLSDQTNRKVIIPSNMLKDDEDIFLDDITVEELSSRLGKEVIISGYEGYDFLCTLLKQNEVN